MIFEMLRIGQVHLGSPGLKSASTLPQTRPAASAALILQQALALQPRFHDPVSESAAPSKSAAREDRMDFTLPEELRLLKDNLRRYVDKEMIPHERETLDGEELKPE
jgi:hypothetical protein